MVSPSIIAAASPSFTVGAFGTGTVVVADAGIVVVALPDGVTSGFASVVIVLPDGMVLTELCPLLAPLPSATVVAEDPAAVVAEDGVVVEVVEVVVEVEDDPEITNVTETLPEPHCAVDAAVARTVQLPAAVYVRTPVDDPTVQPVVPALVTT
jgi:hypothetical protein